MDIEELLQHSIEAGIKNRVKALRVYLSRHSRLLSNNISEVNLELLDIEELTYCTRILKDEIPEYLQRLADERLLWQTDYSEPLKYYLVPIQNTTMFSSIKFNKDFDKKHFDWDKPNRIPTKTKLSKD